MSQSSAARMSRGLRLAKFLAAQPEMQPTPCILGREREIYYCLIASGAQVQSECSERILPRF